MLPSGLVRDQLEHAYESKSQAEKKKRLENRALNHPSLFRPHMCEGHNKICVASVPESPKEVIPGRDGRLGIVNINVSSSMISGPTVSLAL